MWHWQYLHVSAVWERIIINFQHIRQVAPQCLTLLSYATAANRSLGMLAMTICRALPYVGGLYKIVLPTLKAGGKVRSLRFSYLCIHTQPYIAGMLYLSALIFQGL